MTLEWEDINLQDQVEEARAELYRTQGGEDKGGSRMKVLKESQGGQQAAVTAEDLALINLLSRKELKEEDVYVFSLRLCDNEVDRDQERFAPQTLEELSRLFVGKSGIFDHQWSARGQAARIYKTEVIFQPGAHHQGRGRLLLAEGLGLHGTDRGLQRT